MKILVLNCGSSSVKYKLIDMATQQTLGVGVVEKIGMKGSFLKHTTEEGEKIMFEGEILEHSTAIEYVLGVLTSDKYGALTSLEELSAVGHRLVHGGEKFNTSVLITDDVIAKVEECVEIAPLHNPPNLAGIRAVADLLPNIPQVGVFDTAFHHTIPAHAYTYGIPYQLYTKYGVRRYGFHGTSHRYVSKRACDFLGLDYNNTKIITAHIGNGGSCTAIKNGESIDTSMGFTPIEGLIMGTRSGDIDLGAVLYIMEKEMLGVKSLSTLFNKYSGVLGISGVSSDMRDIEAAIEAGNERASLAMDAFNYRILKYIGSYAAALNGVDVIVFTGGVGENQYRTRDYICNGLNYLGVEYDVELNKKTRGEEIELTLPGSKVRVVIIPTDEEMMIAMDTKELVKNA